MPGRSKDRLIDKQRIDGLGHFFFYHISISLKRAMYKDTGKYSNFKSKVF